MVKARTFLLTALLIVLPTAQCKSAEVIKQTDFTGVVIKKAIEFLPQEVRSKVSSAEKEIISAAKPKSASEKPFSELFYFVSKKKVLRPKYLLRRFGKLEKA